MASSEGKPPKDEGAAAEMRDSDVSPAKARDPWPGVGAGQSFTNLRRRKLTQVDVLSAAPPLRSLRPLHVLVALLLPAVYVGVVLPRLWRFGERRWRASVASGLVQARPGGPFADVSFAYAMMLSVTYVSLAFIGINRMALRLPVKGFIFECMAVHNVTQCLFNLYCFAMLLAEGWSLGLGLWGNPYDASDRSHALGGLIWLQYHCRQLQLMETFFMVFRKKFQGVSFLHLYLRVLNLWGWYIACRHFGGGEAYFPALVSSACQASVYGLYFSFSLFPAEAPPPEVAGGSRSTCRGGTGGEDRVDAAGSAAPPAGRRATRAARVFELQIAQYVVCALHAIAAAALGNFPVHLAVLHLLVIGQGLVLYTDFHSTPLGHVRSADFGGVSEGAQSETVRRGANGSDGAARRVTFSFDSCGWLMVYHFGVAAYISEHCGLEVLPSGPSAANERVSRSIGFSGSSGGSLVSCVLGAGTRVRDVFEYILEKYPECHVNPLRMFPAVEQALRKFQYDGAHKHLTGRVRVLLTRVSSSPPFVMGEVADSFPDNETAVKILCASCHVPFVAGLLPRQIGGRYYYDGLLWPSRLLVPWRGAEGDHVVRVSASGAPLADIRAPVRIPAWWMIMPPPPDILRGFFWIGYRDAARWFAAAPAAAAKFDPCRCRRPPDDLAADGGVGGGRPARAGQADVDERGDESAAARWRAARALLLCGTSSAPSVPEVDTATGQNVEALIAATEAMANRQFGVAGWISAALVACAASMVAAAAPSVL